MTIGMKIPGFEFLDNATDEELRQWQIMGCLVRKEDPNKWASDFTFEPYTAEEIKAAEAKLMAMNAAFNEVLEKFSR